MTLGKNFLVILILSVCSKGGQATSFENLIVCKDWSGFRTECQTKEETLSNKMNVHSRFDIKYQFNCDVGTSGPAPSPIEIQIETENGQSQSRNVQFKNSEFFSVDGFGPIKLTNSDPELLKNLVVDKGCSLSVTVEQGKSDRTIQEEQNFIANINNFLNEAEKSIAEEFKLMVQYRADVVAVNKDQAAIACTIKKYDGDSLYSEIIDELKFKFHALFSKVYSPEWCASDQENLAMVNDCPEDSTTRSCIYKLAYFKSKGKIDRVKDATAHYLGQGNVGDFHARLSELSRKINEGFNEESIH
jgi:hypothetical protein